MEYKSKFIDILKYLPFMNSETNKQEQDCDCGEETKTSEQFENSARIINKNIYDFFMNKINEEFLINKKKWAMIIYKYPEIIYDSNYITNKINKDKEKTKAYYNKKVLTFCKKNNFSLLTFKYNVLEKGINVFIQIGRTDIKSTNLISKSVNSIKINLKNLKKNYPNFPKPDPFSESESSEQSSKEQSSKEQSIDSYEYISETEIFNYTKI